MKPIHYVHGARDRVQTGEAEQQYQEHAGAAEPLSRRLPARGRKDVRVHMIVLAQRRSDRLIRFIFRHGAKTL